MERNQGAASQDLSSLNLKKLEILVGISVNADFANLAGQSFMNYKIAIRYS